MEWVNTLKRAFQLPDLRQRILFTVWILVVYRIGVFVPVPGVDVRRIQSLFEQEGTLVGFLDLFAGGALSNFSVFAMGIMPYINASIIMQLLTVVVPTFEEWAKEGEEGRRKMAKVTRFGTVGLALIQAVGMTFFFQTQFQALTEPTALNYFIVILTLTTGTTLLMWLGELITEHGIGNGISLLIFGSIVAALPPGAGRLLVFLETGRLHVIALIILGVAALAITAGIVWVHEGQRRIPVRYSKRVVGRKMYGGQSAHIPIKVNQAGVIPVIFAAAILAFPPTLVMFVDQPWAQRMAELFAFDSPFYVATFAVMIMFFTYFYTAITFNPRDVAQNIKKYGGFIPGIRPGKQTAQFLDRVLIRITLVGAIFLAAVSVMPYGVQGILDVNIYFGGVSLLILVGVALQTMKQIEAHMMMRHYQGFMR